jgi:hypothetical protein
MGFGLRSMASPSRASVLLEDGGAAASSAPLWSLLMLRALMVKPYWQARRWR